MALGAQRRSLGSCLRGARSPVGKTDVQLRAVGGKPRSAGTEGTGCSVTPEVGTAPGRLWQGLTKKVLFGFRLDGSKKSCRKGAIKLHIIP